MTTAFSVMLKPHGARCNLDCSYCYYLPKEHLYPGGSFTMSDEVLETFTRQYIAAQPGPEVLFAWQGGEPLLLGMDFYRKAVTYQRKYCPPGKFVSNTLQTNATLLDDEWCCFLRENGFLVGVSLDGPALMHDAFRQDKGGQPSFKRVMAGVRRLQRWGVEINALTAVHAANSSNPLQVYSFLRDEVGAEFIQFIPIVEHAPSAGRWGVDAQQYGDFLIAIFDEWSRRDVGKVFVQLFDVALGVYLGFPASLCLFRETCGLGLALEHNGDLYVCDHFVDPAYRLGNLTTSPLVSLVSSSKQLQFGGSKWETLLQICRECEVGFLCNGECPKNRFLTTPDGQPGLNYLCAGYKAFFKHIDAPMRKMSAAICNGRQGSGQIP